MFFSNNTYTLNSSLSPEEIQTGLSEKTVQNPDDDHNHKDKEFMGKIEKNTFSLTNSSFPYNMACVFQGNINEGEGIQIHTSLHRPFKTLYMVWTMAIALFLLVFGIECATAMTPGLATFLFAAIFVRLFMYVTFIMARSKGIDKLKKILQKR